MSDKVCPWFSGSCLDRDSCNGCDYYGRWQSLASGDKPSGWELAIRERGKCGSCAGSLAEGYMNIAPLDKYATWKFPVWRNILARAEDKRTPRMACTLLCDTCIDLRKTGKAPPIKWALEVYQENDVYKLRYHDVRTLEAAEPVTEEDLE